MKDNNFRSKAAFIIETDGLLKDYLETVVIKRIKAGMPDDSFKNLSANHLHAAMILKSISPCALKTFAETMRMSKAAASALVDRMVRAGIISREENPHNRREVLLTVSPDFEAHIGYVRTEMIRWFEVLAKKIGMENFEKWHAVMAALNGILKDEIKSGRSII